MPKTLLPILRFRNLTGPFSAGKLLVLVSILIAGIYCTPVRAQFTEITEQLETEIVMPPNVYGSAISFYDIDGNGWDDLTISGRHNDPHFFLNFEGELSPAPIEIVNFNNAEIVGMIWGDIENDGDADLLITKKNSAVELYKNNGEMEFTNVTNGSGLPDGAFNYMGAAFCDYNHDGFLDVYITKYYHPTQGTDGFTSVLLRNQGDGTFEDVTVSSGAYLPPRPSFQPAFLDVNQDGWEDLYIAIDRVEFPNELFINNGDGTFTNITEGSGADIFVCSMTATVGDYDHDTDLDVYVTSNPTTDNVLLRNEGANNFENVTGNFPGLEVGYNCWGSMWLDYNNDSWEDLFVGTMAATPTPIGNQFFRNQNGTGFTNVSNFLQINLTPSEAHVCAKGDLNNDGYEDFAITNRYPNPSRLFLNNGGSNHFIGVGLEGVIANRDGVGTWIHCYAGGEHTSQFTLSGENLYGQNSSRKVFGLGGTDQVDSLILEWNSGTRDVYYQPQIDQYHHYIEGASDVLPFSIHPDDTAYLCAGDTIEFDAGDYASYLWNTEDDSQFLAVSEPGTYYVEVLTSWGLATQSVPVVVLMAPETSAELSVDHPSCANADNGSVFLMLNAGNIESIEWNNGAILPFVDDLKAGIYWYELQDEYGCWQTDTIELYEPAELTAEAIVNPVACYGENTGSAVLNISGGTPPWQSEWGGVNPDSLSAGMYPVTVVDWNDCTWSDTITIDQPDSLSIQVITYDQFGDSGPGAASLSVSGGSPPYTIFWSTGDFDTDSLPNLIAGEYSVLVEDAQSCTEEIDFEILLFTGTSLIESTKTPIVFPNPFDEQIRFKHCGDSQSLLELYNQRGQLVLRHDSFNCSESIHLSGLAPGIYTLRLIREEQIHTFRLSKSNNK